MVSSFILFDSFYLNFTTSKDIVYTLVQFFPVFINRFKDFSLFTG